MFKKFISLILFTFVSLITAPASWSQALTEHEMLKMDDGKWSAAITLHSGDDQPPERYMGVETNTMVGDLWSVGKLEIMIGDTPYVGFATLGYDPAEKQYVGTWVDSTSPHITEMNGNYDAATATLTLFYTTIASDGRLEERKNVMIYRDPNARDFVGFLKKEGNWKKSMEIQYERLD